MVATNPADLRVYGSPGALSARTLEATHPPMVSLGTSSTHGFDLSLFRSRRNADAGGRSTQDQRLALPHSSENLFQITSEDRSKAARGE